jgi:NAD(P)-dependent dehydrogenase (short-subunit alcohol dehydrogenase family)
VVINVKRAPLERGMRRSLLVCFLLSVAAIGAVDAQQATPGTVLITGANRGLGLEFARQYAERGWTVIATARDKEAPALVDLQRRFPDVSIESLDVRDVSSIRALALAYQGRPIDVLINNAGVLGEAGAQTLGSLDYDEFEQVMAVNTFAPLALAEAFREHVAASDQKKIVSITSRSGIISLPGSRGPYFYRASKVAMNMVMRVLAEELRAQAVIVALISPPPTDTDMLRQLIGPEAASRQANPAEVVSRLIEVIDGLTLESAATPIYFDGTAMPW